MKSISKLLVAAAVTLSAVVSYGQGSINFNNAAVGVKITDKNGVNVGSTVAGDGTNYFAQLYWAPGTVTDMNLLNPVAGALVNFRSLANGGSIQVSGTTSLGTVITTTAYTVPTPTPGGIATFQIRAWYGGGSVYTSYYNGTTFNGANLNGLAQYGFSNLITIQTGDTTPPAATPPNMVGLQTFQLVPVPEPGTLALAGLGAASLLLFRRKK